MHICSWNDNENEVSTCYFSSQFLWETPAEDVFNSFNICLSPLDGNKSIHSSSDGPNVSLAFLKLLDKKREDDE